MSGQIFISYRRQESRWSARSLRDRLCRDFDPKQIFMDIDAIAVGEDFVEAIETTVAKCDVLIAVIGNNWLTSKDDHGNRRLDNPEDFVRMEIGAALKRKIRVIPVLVDGALMPQSTDLPEDLKPLVRRNALLITETSFDGDCQRLAAAIRQVLEKAAAQERERLGTEQRQREEKGRLEVEQRQREEKDRPEAERRQHDDKEQLKASSDATFAPVPILPSISLALDGSSSISNIAFAPDLETLASGSAHNTVRLWRVSDGKLLHTLTGHKFSISAVTFSPDGTSLASGSFDHTVRLWRISDGKLLHTLTGHGDTINTVAFSPDGTLLASGSSDKSVRLWRVSDGSLLHELKGHTQWVHTIAFSRDGAMLASGSMPMFFLPELRLWRIPNGELVHSLQGEKDTVRSVGKCWPLGQRIIRCGCGASRMGSSSTP